MSVETEEWRAIDGLPDYEVSDWGRVRSWRRPWRAPYVLALSRSPQPPGYLQVRVCVDVGVSTTVVVHRAVTAAFLGPRPDGLVTRHLDGDPQNNALSNLRYGTVAENGQDSLRHGTNYHARKTHCKHGHPLSGDNVRVRNGGKHRRCVTCQQAASAASYQRRLARAVRGDVA